MMEQLKRDLIGFFCEGDISSEAEIRLDDILKSYSKKIKEEIESLADPKLKDNFVIISGQKYVKLEDILKILDMKD